MSIITVIGENIPSRKKLFCTILNVDEKKIDDSNKEIEEGLFIWTTPLTRKEENKTCFILEYRTLKQNEQFLKLIYMISSTILINRDDDNIEAGLKSLKFLSHFEKDQNFSFDLCKPTLLLCCQHIKKNTIIEYGGNLDQNLLDKNIFKSILISNENNLFYEKILGHFWKRDCFFLPEYKTSQKEYERHIDLLKNNLRENSRIKRVLGLELTHRMLFSYISTLIENVHDYQHFDLNQWY